MIQNHIPQRIVENHQNRSESSTDNFTVLWNRQLCDMLIINEEFHYSPVAKFWKTQLPLAAETVTPRTACICVHVLRCSSYCWRVINSVRQRLTREHASVPRVSSYC